MASIYPTFAIAPPVRGTAAAGTAGAAAEPPAYPPGPLLDFETMRYMTDGAGRLVVGSGYQAWVQWCAKALFAERFAYRAYSPRYGVELEGVIGEADPGLARLRYERTVREALLANPRTGAVDNFAFEDAAGDLVRARCTVRPAVPTVGPPVDVTFWLTAPAGLPR